MKEPLGTLRGIQFSSNKPIGSGAETKTEEEDGGGIVTLLSGDLQDGAMGKLTLAVRRRRTGDTTQDEHLVLKTTHVDSSHSGNLYNTGLDWGGSGMDCGMMTGQTVSSSSSGDRCYYWDPTLMQEAYILALSGTKRTITGAMSVPLRAVFYGAWPTSPTHTVDVGARGRAESGSQHNEKLYLALEFAAGGDLYTWIEHFQMRPSRVKGRLVLPIVSDIGHVVRNLHHAGWVHRDIKPENVLLDTNSRAQLGDFGFSRPILTAEDRVGTVEYHSPELWHRGQNGPQADMWAIGMVLHRMLQRVDPQHFDAIVRLHILKQNAAAAQLATHRFEVAQLTRLIECAFHCGGGVEWRMDAQAFRRHCATLCVPKKDAGTLWQVYQGCLQPDARQRWTSDQLCEFLQAVSSSSSTSTHSSSSSSGSEAHVAVVMSSKQMMDEGEDDLGDASTSFVVGPLSPIRLRPGFRFCPPPLTGVTTWLRKPPSPLPLQQHIDHHSLPVADVVPPILHSAVAREPPHSPGHSSKLLGAEYQNVVHDFARSLSQFMCWTAKHSVMAFQASVEVFACIMCHLQPNPVETLTAALIVRQIAALQLVETVLLDDLAAPQFLGFAQCQRSLESRLLLVDNESTSRRRESQQRVADIQHAWLQHLLSDSASA